MGLLDHSIVTHPHLSKLELGKKKKKSKTEVVNRDLGRSQELLLKAYLPHQNI